MLRCTNSTSNSDVLCWCDFLQRHKIGKRLSANVDINIMGYWSHGEYPFQCNRTGASTGALIPKKCIRSLLYHHSVCWVFLRASMVVLGHSHCTPATKNIPKTCRPHPIEYVAGHTLLRCGTVSKTHSQKMVRFHCAIKAQTPYTVRENNGAYLT